MPQGKIGIFVSGGPAPGINAVIGAVTIEALNQGVSVVGFRGGFRGIHDDGAAAGSELSIDDVSQIYNTGGSVLGTSRFNPLTDREHTQHFVDSIAEAGVDKVVIIGGEGSAWVSHKLAHFAPELRIAHVPKTIDNDIPLPHDQPTFGFETARSVGKGIVDTLVTDAKTCERWYIVETMGRQAGFIALGTALSSGATLALIPEEFGSRTYSPKEVAEIVAQSIRQRWAIGKRYGVAILAEGILDRLDPSSSSVLESCPRDDLDRITYSEIELGDVILPELKSLCSDLGNSLTLRTKNIGYELRCAPPVASDIEYGRFLGHGAVQALLHRNGQNLISRNGSDLEIIPLEHFFPDGTLSPRTIMLDSELFQMAKRYMVRPDLAG